jgi:hypothetical protein
LDHESAISVTASDATDLVHNERSAAIVPTQRFGHEQTNSGNEQSKHMPFSNCCGVRTAATE